MTNFIEFSRMFLSYLLVFGITCVLGAVGIFIGIKTRISKNAKQSAVASEDK